MTVGEYFKMSFSIIFLSCLIPKRIIINIIWQSYYSKIDHRLGYIGVKDFSNELNCKKSLNLIQYLEDDILNYLSTVMFRVFCLNGWHSLNVVIDKGKLKFGPIV